MAKRGRCAGRRGRRASAVVAALAALGGARGAGADASIVVREGRGQGALALAVVDGKLRATVCARAASCSAASGAVIDVPESVAPRLVTAALVEVPLGEGRRLARVDVPLEGGGAWVALLAAPVGAAARDVAPAVPFQGFVGVPKGAEGEARSVQIVVEGDANARRVVVGERREDVSLCGRPTLVAAREIDPGTLRLVRGASIDSVPAAERAAAPRLVAKRLPGAAAPSDAPRLLRARAASSAVERKFATLTDGDPTTTWSEGKPGDGRGEFVTMAASTEVGVTSIELVVRGEGDELADGAAPRTLEIATSERLFEVELPEDAWASPGARFSVELPEEVRSACFAIVLGKAWARPGVKDPAVSLAEVTAHTAFDGAGTDALAGALAGGGARARGAAVMLGRAGAAGVSASMAAYPTLDDAGRELARGVVDAAPCAEQAPFFAKLLVEAASAPDAERRGPPGEREGAEALHARDRLRRCGRVAAPALAAQVTSGAPRGRIAAATELSLVAPAEAIPVLADAMAAAEGDALRRELRDALARAARSERALPALAAELAPERVARRTEPAKIDLLRAAGPSLGRVEGGASAFAAVATSEASPRTRYLLLGPAAELALAGDAAALSWLGAALARDADPHVRARAAEVAGGVPALASVLVGAVDDPEPRVREAAVAAIAKLSARGTPPPDAALGVLARRLAGEPWTFVKVGAARALATAPADANADRALAAMLRDASLEARGAAIDALGAHRAAAHADAIRARQDDEDENLEVRARAILALGALCDARSIDTHTTLARRAASPISDADRRLGAAAIAALGDAHPADLEKRLAPALGKDAPREVVEMAKAALAAPRVCR